MAGVTRIEAPGQRAINTLEASTPEKGRRIKLYSHSKPTEQMRELRRDEAIQGIFERARSLTPLDGGFRSLTPIVDIPGTNGEGYEVVREADLDWQAEGTHPETIAIRRHFPPTEKKPRGSYKTILRVKGEVFGDNGSINEHITLPAIPRDWDAGRVFDRALIEAGEALNIIEAATHPDDAYIEQAGGVGIIRELRAAREVDYHLFDSHLLELTTAQRADGSKPSLVAFHDWCEARDAQAEIDYDNAMGEAADKRALAAADERLFQANARIDVGSANRTYRNQQEFLDQFASVASIIEAEILLAQRLPDHVGDPNPTEAPQSVNIQALQAEARRQVIRTLRNRRARIASGDIDVTPRPRRRAMAGY